MDKRKRIANTIFGLGLIFSVFGFLALFGHLLIKIFSMKTLYYIEFLVVGVILLILGVYLRNRVVKRNENKIVHNEPESSKDEKQVEITDNNENVGSANDSSNTVHDEEPVKEDEYEIESVELDDPKPDNFVYSNSDNSIRNRMSEIIGNWSKWNEHEDDPVKVKDACLNLKEYVNNVIDNDEIYLNTKSEIDYNQFSACLSAIWSSINGAMYNLSLFIKNDENRLKIPSEDELRLISSICSSIIEYVSSSYDV